MQSAIRHLSLLMATCYLWGRVQAIAGHWRVSEDISGYCRALQDIFNGGVREMLEMPWIRLDFHESNFIELHRITSNKHLQWRLMEAQGDSSTSQRIHSIESSPLMHLRWKWEPLRSQPWENLSPRCSPRCSSKRSADRTSRSPEIKSGKHIHSCQAGWIWKFLNSENGRNGCEAEHSSRLSSTRSVFDPFAFEMLSTGTSHRPSMTVGVRWSRL